MSELAQQALQKADALLHARQMRDALAAYNQAEAEGADENYCAGQRWTCFMLLGAYERAWEQSDALRARNAPDPQRVWDGSSVDGKRVLVRSVHGLGDAVQMLRYMPLLRRQAARTTLQVAPALVALARCAAGVDEVVAWEEERPFDVELEITELPYVLRSPPQRFLSDVPYLSIPPKLRNRAGTWLGVRRRPRVGLAWTSSAWDSSRSLPLAALKLLLQAGGESVDFWCLQPGAMSAEWAQICRERHWPERRAGDHPLAMFAACVAEMDLVITIDSFAAHLAGALAKPAWVLLKYRADWRWMHRGRDSPWYPTMQLFRQGAADDWAGVIAEVSEALRVWVAGTSVFDETG